MFNLTLFQPVNPYIKKACLTLMFVSLFLPNTLLTIYAIASLLIILHITWPKGHLPLITVCLLFQWLQASIKVFQASFTNQSLNEFTESPLGSKAIFLAITGTLAVALGFHFIIRNKVAQRTIFNGHQYEDKTLFKLFMVLFAISNVVQILNSFLPAGISQITLSLSYLQWIGYAMLFIGVLKNKGNIKYLIVAFIIEMAVNLFGFFSNFREVILFTIILCLPFLKKLNLSIFIGYTVALYVTYSFFIGWTGIKQDFRAAISGDTELSYTERVSSFYDLYTNFNDFEEAEQNGLDRLGYTDMLMYSLETVPILKPHENGKLWLSAIQHILMPRFLFPNKKVLHDSEKANLYTNRHWAGAAEGTSISIGYVTESYVDFGEMLMFLPLLLLGVLLGLIYNKVNSLKTSTIIAFSTAATIIFFTKLSLLETSGDKLLGAMVMNFLILYLVAYRYSDRVRKYISGD